MNGWSGMPIGMLETSSTSLTLAVGALCLVMVTIALLRWSQQRAATTRDLTREERARLREQRELQQGLEDLLTQLEEVNQRINAQLDSRFKRLEALIREADQRIGPAAQVGEARPKAAVHAGPTVASTSAGPAPATGGSGAPPLAQQRQRICELADSGTPPLAIADMLRIPVGEVELILNLRKFK